MKTVEEMLTDMKARGVSAAMAADEMGITKAAMSRFKKGLPSLGPDKVSEFHAIYARVMKTPRPRAPRGNSRNDEIIRLAATGMVYEEIGKQFDISRQRVHAIVSKYGLPARQRG